MNTQGFKYPNLDDISSKEQEIWQRVFTTLAAYCAAKENASLLRRHGRIQTALVAEERAQQMYNELPEWAKW